MSAAPPLTADERSARIPKDVLVFLDESGDHNLRNVDSGFPVFALAAVIIRPEDYRSDVVPLINDLKLRFFPHEGVNLHNHEIRKQKRDFAVLREAAVRERFLAELTRLMRELPYELVAVCIDKQKLVTRYKLPDHPYELALKYLVERLTLWSKANGNAKLQLIAESRGNREDDSLKAAMLDLLQEGTTWTAPTELAAAGLRLTFRPKSDNVIGMQLADLCAYPAARHALNRGEPSRAWNAVAPHLATSLKSSFKLFPA